LAIFFSLILLTRINLIVFVPTPSFSNIESFLTFFIVVESELQWEILRRKEKQGLSNHSSLEFDNQEQTSEPPWWVMLACVLGYLFYRRRTIEV